MGSDNGLLPAYDTQPLSEPGLTFRHMRYVAITSEQLKFGHEFDPYFVFGDYIFSNYYRTSRHGTMSFEKKNLLTIKGWGDW